MYILIIQKQKSVQPDTLSFWSTNTKNMISISVDRLKHSI